MLTTFSRLKECNDAEVLLLRITAIDLSKLTTMV